MRSSSSPAAPASSARTTSARSWPTTDDEVTVFDALTYAGNLDNLRGLRGRPPLRVRQGRHHATATRCRDAMAGHDAGRALRGREPRRPLDRQPRRVRPHQLRRHQRDVRRRPPGRRRAVPAHLHRRGLRLDRGGLVHRDRPAGAPLAVLGVEGRLRPDRARVPRDLRPARGGHPIVEQLRARTSSPRRSSRSSSPTCSTGSKVPLYGDGLNVRDWCFVDDNCAAVDLVLRQGDDRRDLQHRRRQRDHQPRAHRRASWTCLGHDESMIEYVEDRLGHDRRYSIDIDKVRGPRLGAPRTTSTRRSTRPSPGTATTAGGGNRSLGS